VNTPLESETNPYFLGFSKPVKEERDDRDLVVEGTLPVGLEGMFVKNGPNQVFEPRGKYHPFDGDGMLHAVRIENGRARYKNRWVRTPGFLYEQEKGRSVFGGFADLAPPPADAMQKVGFVKNVANTNVVSHGGKLLALWEGGLPFAVTSELETIGIESFGSKYSGPFTAHPRKDPVSGELYAFGYNAFPPWLVLLVVDANGKLIHQEPITLPKPVMIHDFVITEEHVVFLDAPALFDVQSAMAGKGPIVQWKPELGCRLGVMPRKGKNADVRWFPIDPCYVYHFMNAFAAGSKICVDASRLERLNDFGLDGADPEGFMGRLTRFEIDLETGKVHTTLLSDRGFEFPRVRDSLVGRPYRYGYGAGYSGQSHLAEFDTTLKFDLEKGTVDSYFHGAEQFVGELSFAADPTSSAEDGGWLVGYVYNSHTDKSDFIVLDARDVSKGPIARVHLHSRVPAGIHANWIAADRVPA